MTRDPNSYVQSSVDLLGEVLASKNGDYALGGEFSAFEKAAEFADTEVIKVVVTQMAIKLARIQALLKADKVVPLNEPLKDSFLGAAGYAAIGHAWLESQEPPKIAAHPGKITAVPGPYFSMSGTINREAIRNAFDD